MNIQNKPNLQQKLAAEYVLGTLRGGARRRFEGWLNRDAQLQQVVRQWEGNLLPMAEFAKTAQPATSVWQSLEKRLGLNQSADRWAFWRNLREDLAFWRGLGMFSTAMALVMVSVLLSKQVDQTLPPTNSYVATLSNDKSEPIAVITGDIKHKQLIVHIVKAQNIAADKSLELWAVSKAGTVKSLGLVADNGNITLPMPDNMNSDNVPLLAVTLEPKGGSGNPEKPSGPIIFKGNWLLI
ncbi:anti-sigma factor [Undibacterium sp. RTI2.1]|uniref:anti-sigma factor n=1 Tax=unclassified Undibacterium TaxID=2630295 RepID=UPI002B239932|nr:MULTISPECIES: anti-sigma factor [unclassified Undibacterium]MEB0030111.1 anti-sigma factor [Undibacterium sp. RTI2.1]MEB0116639.1 anti-sigma factor [Undibacterium sp. RTI2.2]